MPPFFNWPTATSFLEAWSAPGAPAHVGPDVLVRLGGPMLRARRDTNLLHAADLPAVLDPSPLDCPQVGHADPPEPLGAVASRLAAENASVVLMACATCCATSPTFALLRQALDVMETARRCTATLADDLVAVAGRNPHQRVTVPEADLVLHLRTELEFAAPDVTPVSAERLDPHNALQGALTHTVATWRAQLEDTLTRLRAVRAEWSQPLIMVTARRPYAPEQHADRQRCVFPDWSDTAGLYTHLALAPLAGILTRAGCAPSPVLCLPAWVDLPDAWVSLGPTRPEQETAALLAACSATFGTDTVGDDVVAAVRTALCAA